MSEVASSDRARSEAGSAISSVSRPASAMPLLRERVRAADPVIGTFVKTTSPQTIEVLGHSGLDFAVLDAEHAPFGVESLDRTLGAARGAGLAALVRIPDHAPAFINTCLDLGASGVLVPHTLTAADAEAIADAARFGRGQRGFSPSGRAGSYGQIDHASYRAAADSGCNIWCQIEDRAAMSRLDEIAAVDAVDCLFIGPADLSLSLGYGGMDDPRLLEAIRAIAAAGRRHGRAVGLYVGNTGKVADMIALGITVFVCGSDQGFMLGRAKQVATDFSSAREKTSQPA
ncbi:HpcH/HpaI aldolase family protein [Novosphingobium profundi]|uniref:HpcH/HpaI aldolase family protein n=1 Tax=Novosphingobium profundi TaxID=1774954 RepID=UPI001BD96C3E